MADLKVLREDDQLTHVALSGRLDVAGVQSLELTFLGHTASRGKPALIDVAAVDYMGSLGLRMLLGSAQALKRKGVSCLVIHPQPAVRETIAMAGLEGLLAPDDEEAAIRLVLGS